MDPFSHPSLSPADFYHGGPSPQGELAPGSSQQQLQPGGGGGGPGPGPGPRNYKSRKYRPCDFCRARQVACKIEVAPPCQLCQSHRRECTFVEQPKKKRRPPAENAGGAATAGAGAAAGSSQGPGSRAATATPSAVGGRVHIDPPQLPMLAQQQSGNDLRDISHLGANYVPQFDERLFERQMSHDHYLDPHQQQHQQHHHHQGLDHDAAADFQLSHLDVPGPHERRLDSDPSHSVRLVGETGEFNPYLLRRYHYDENDECTISDIRYRRIRRKPSVPSSPGTHSPPPVFMLASTNAALGAEPRVEDHVLAQARYDVAQLFTSEQSLRLMGLYFRFVNPYFPILSQPSLSAGGLLSHAAIDALPLSLLAALYAAALPYTPYDDLLASFLAHAPDPSTQLYRTALLALTQELHAPTTATLQTALLLLQRAPSDRSPSDTPWKSSLVGTAVSLAHTLGLSRDSSAWVSLPAWDLAQRKRLWHAVFTLDKWTALTNGTPSHIRGDDFDVPPIWPADCEPLDPSTPDADAADHFRLLADLAAIVADVLDAYFPPRAAARTAANLALSLDLGRPLRARLDAWSANLPPALLAPRGAPQRRRGGNPSLYLAYLVANMTLFRALLRPLEGGGGGGGEARERVNRSAVRAGARECAEEAVVFAEGLQGGGMEGFWHSWSRANFAIVAAFLTQLLLTAETEAEGAEISNLVARWRWAMRMGAAGGPGGGGAGNAGGGGSGAGTPGMIGGGGLGFMGLSGLTLEGAGGEAGSGGGYED